MQCFRGYWSSSRGGNEEAPVERQSALGNQSRGNAARSRAPSSRNHSSSPRQEPGSRSSTSTTEHAPAMLTQPDFGPPTSEQGDPNTRRIVSRPQTRDDARQHSAVYSSPNPTDRQQPRSNLPEDRAGLAEPDKRAVRRQKRTRNFREPLFRRLQSDSPRNIVVFGETGTGKSSLINMLSDSGVAKVSNLAVGCTFESSSYPITVDGVPYILWDTAGLNEGDSGSVPADTALRHLHDLVEKLHDGLSLLVYCIRGSRYRDIIKVNYDLFKEIICQGEVPIVIVVTGLENEECMDDWWVENEKEFTSRKMRFEGHACVTTTKGKKDMFEEEYEESKAVLREMIKTKCPPDAWVVDSDAWLQRITERIQEYYDEYNGYSSAPMATNEGQLPTGNILSSLLGAMLPLIPRRWLPF